MDGPPRLFSASPVCPTCPVLNTCGAEMTDKACPGDWPVELPGGEVVSHPRKVRTQREIQSLGGVKFDDVIAIPSPVPAFPQYLPQVRNRTSLRGFLKEGTYAVRAKDVIKKRRVISADEMRERLGLERAQILVLILFDRDEILEDLWEKGGPLVWRLAEASYELVVPPSFSTYTPRPRTEFLINARRSMLYFGALQDAQIPTIPRVAWQVTHDVRRYARWACDNATVRTVAIDLSTYRSVADWVDQLAGLAAFDVATRRRMSYLINGVTTKARCADLFRIVPPTRVFITNSTTQARIASQRLRPIGDQTGATFRARCEVRRGAVEAAAAKLNPKEDQDERSGRAA